ncbi:hypothetical protein D3C87_1288210 [compost metagenome]
MSVVLGGGIAHGLGQARPRRVSVQVVKDTELARNGDIQHTHGLPGLGLKATRRHTAGNGHFARRA